MKTIMDLEKILAQPNPALVEDIRKLDGDILILGVGGKMGSSLARRAHNAIKQAGVNKKVIGVSRFSSGHLQRELEADGIETIAADLLEDKELNALPEVENVIYMVGHKFGTTGNEFLTWAMNTYIPGKVAEKYRNSRIVVFSTGNVYPLTPISLGGTCEKHPTGPVGEYAQSCLGRERLFEYFSHKYQTPIIQFRLNYAIDMRYGILHEIAKAVYEQGPINVSMGNVNVIWQGDANEMAIRSLAHCECPPRVINVTGPEMVSIRWVANEFGSIFDQQPIFTGEEQPTALLSNASQCHQLFGYPKVSLRQMIAWTADWIMRGGESLNKPTLFQEREGKF